MDIWLAIDGEKKGPYTLLEVQGKVRDESISGDTIGWYKGCDAWRPIRSLAPFQDMLREKAEDEAREAEEAESEELVRELDEEESEKEEEKMASHMMGTAHVLARPWLRFWARNLDELLLFFILLGFLGLLRRFEITSVPYSWLFDPIPMVVSILGSAFLEAAFLATWGATPGKMLMGIRVENEGSPALGFKMALNRSLRVLIQGLAFKIPLATQLAMGLSFFHHRQQNETAWDQQLQLDVTYRPVGVMKRFVISIGLFLVLVWFFQDPLLEIRKEIETNFSTR